MEQLLSQLSNLLSDAREMTPDFIGRIQPLVIKWFEHRGAVQWIGIAIGIVLILVAGAFTVKAVQVDRAKNYSDPTGWVLGAVFGGLIGLTTFGICLGYHIYYAWLVTFVQVDFTAWLISNGIGIF